MFDLQAFLDTFKKTGFFNSSAPITVARAPGRLDVMGGIADYSGSLVLQRPIAEATFAAVQRQETGAIEILSLAASAGMADRTYAIDLAALVPGGEPIGYESARDIFRSTEHHWAAYVAGVFLVLSRERRAVFSEGARVLIASAVPEAKGVASSAALEVAVMQAVSAAFELDLPAPELAVLCQKVENLVAGAPCGLMDQMACTLGEADSLMALLCQPAQLQPAVRVPPGISFWGMDSGERHAVTGSDYISVRTGAFMGYRMMCADGIVGEGYLANVSPSEFEREYLSRLPEEMSGASFLKSFSDNGDTVTTVDPSRTYRIRQSAAHPVYEHQRVVRFRQLLQGRQGEEQWTLLGELMYQSHAGYSACGLGSPATDLIVRLVRAAGPSRGLYGARITGGGSGGTVAILAAADAENQIAELRRAFEMRTGHSPYVFAGSSGGAASFGTKRFDL